MKKLYVFMFLSVIFLIAFVSAKVLTESESNELDGARVDGDVSHCENIDDVGVKDSCYAIIVGNSENPDETLCEKITSLTVKNSCYNSASYAKGDPLLCEKIVGDSFMSDFCYINVAKSNLEVSFCDKVVSSDQKDFCYENVAKVNKDSSLCNDIKNGRYRDSCFSSLGKKDPKLPNYNSGESSQGFFPKIFAFFRNLFGNKKNSLAEIPECSKERLLSQMKGEGYDESIEGFDYSFEMNHQNCYIDYAVKNNEASVCNFLEGQKVQECISKVAISQNNSELCSGLDDPVYRYGCFNNVAIATGDYNLCNEIERDSDKKNLCLTEVARAKGDVEICNQIKEEVSTFYIDQCRSIVTVSAGDSSQCEELNGQENRNNCYINIGGKTGDLSVCDKVEIGGGDAIIEETGESGSVVYCHVEIYERYSDSSICDTLSSKMKNYCIQWFSNN